ncbi:MAG: hypothetical protein AAFP69_22235 [Planctomycetota bacterium]
MLGYLAAVQFTANLSIPCVFCDNGGVALPCCGRLRCIAMTTRMTTSVCGGLPMAVGNL